MQLSVSFFDNLKDRAPQAVDLTWRDLCDLLADAASIPTDRSLKPEVLAFTPCRYMTGCSRAKRHVAEVFAVTVDVDDGAAMPFVAMVERLTSLDLTFAVHSTTWSSLAANRYRVIFPLARPVAGADFPALYSSVQQAFGGLADRACSDASRLNILPRFWTGDWVEEIDGLERQVEPHHAISFGDGQPLDPDRLMRRFPPIVQPEIEPVVISAMIDHPDLADFDRSPIVTQAIVDQYLNSPPGGRLFRFMTRIATRALYREFAITPEIVAALALEMNRRGPAAQARGNLRREAQRAINGAARFVAANPKTQPETIRPTLTAGAALKILKARRNNKK